VRLLRGRVPFGVIDRRPDPLAGAGGAFKCTFCHDRQASGLTPACAKACPTESIQFGPLVEMRARAGRRVAELEDRGVRDVTVYDPVNTSVGGIHAIFLIPGDPSSWGLPPMPVVPTVLLRGAWTSAVLTAAGAMAGVLAAFFLT
jgi:formate dehydrogenase iron-sulfur subunit